MFPSWDPCGESLLIHIRVPSGGALQELHKDERPVFNGMWPCSPRVCLDTAIDSPSAMQPYA